MASEKVIVDLEFSSRLDPRSLNLVHKQVNKAFANTNVVLGTKFAPQFTDELDKNIKGVDRLAKSAKNTGSALNQLSQDISKYFIRFSAFTIAASTIFASIRQIQEAARASLEFDRSLVKVAQITGTTRRSLKGLSGDIFNLSTNIGASSQDLFEASVTLAQTGLAVNKLKGPLEALAKTSLSPTFGDMKQTTEGLIAVLAQFDIQVEKSEQALSSINAVASKYAVESQDIISAVRKAGGVFSQAGGSLEQFIGLFTAIRSTTRETAETIGVGLRTIVTRLQRVDTSQFLERLGIKGIRDEVTGELRPIQEVFEILANGVKRFSTNSPEFAQIIEKLGGVRQVGKIIPLLTRFNLALDAQQVALDGSNSLSDQTVVAQDALAVQFSKTRAEFEKFLNALTQDQVLRSFITTTLSLAQSLTKLAEAFQPIIPILGVIGVSRLIRPVTAIGSAVGSNVAPFIKRNSGGSIPGNGFKDEVPALLTKGEYVLNKQAVRRLGVNTLDSLNSGGVTLANTGGHIGADGRARYQEGGSVEEARASVAALNAEVIKLEKTLSNLANQRPVTSNEAFSVLEQQVVKTNELADAKVKLASAEQELNKRTQLDIGRSSSGIATSDTTGRALDANRSRGRTSNVQIVSGIGLSPSVAVRQAELREQDLAAQEDRDILNRRRERRNPSGISGNVSDAFINNQLNRNLPATTPDEIRRRQASLGAREQNRVGPTKFRDSLLNRGESVIGGGSSPILSGLVKSKDRLSRAYAAEAIANGKAATQADALSAGRKKADKELRRLVKSQLGLPSASRKFARALGDATTGVLNIVPRTGGAIKRGAGRLRDKILGPREELSPEERRSRTRRRVGVGVFAALGAVNSESGQAFLSNNVGNKNASLLTGGVNTAVGGAALGFSLGGPVGAALGGVTGAAVGTFTALKQFEKELSEQNVTDALNAISDSANITAAQLLTLQQATASETKRATTDATSADKLIIGALGAQLSSLGELFVSGKEVDLNQNAIDIVKNANIAADKSVAESNKPIASALNDRFNKLLKEGKTEEADKLINQLVIATDLADNGRRDNDVAIRDEIEARKALSLVILSSQSDIINFATASAGAIVAQNRFAANLDSIASKPIQSLSNPASLIRSRTGLQNIGSTAFAQDLTSVRGISNRNKGQLSDVNKSVPIIQDILKGGGFSDKNFKKDLIEALRTQLKFGAGVDDSVIEQFINTIKSDQGVFKDQSSFQEGLTDIEGTTNVVISSFKELIENTNKLATAEEGAQRRLLSQVDSLFGQLNLKVDANAGVRNAQRALAQTQESLGGRKLAVGLDDRFVRQRVQESTGVSSVAELTTLITNLRQEAASTEDPRFATAANNAVESLKLLTDAGARTGDILTRLGKIEEGKASQRGIARQLLFAEGTDKADIQRKLGVATAFAAGGGDIRSFGVEAQRAIIEGLETFGAAEVGGTGKTGTKLAEEALNRLGGITPSREEKGLREDIDRIGESSITAAKALALEQDKIFKSHASQMDGNNKEFLASLHAIVVGSRRGFSSGGFVSGSGSGDTVPAMLTPGEGILNRSAMGRVGVDQLNQLNSGGRLGFAEGGVVPSIINIGGMEALNSFNSNFGANIERLSQAIESIPANISMTVSHRLDVSHNGAQWFSELEPSLQKLAESTVKQAINKMLKSKFPNAGTI